MIGSNLTKGITSDLRPFHKFEIKISPEQLLKYQTILSEDDFYKLIGRGFIDTYMELLSEDNLKPKFKKGDKVEVVRKVSSEEGWSNTWVSPEMDDYIGKEFTIRAIYDEGVYFEGVEEFEAYGFPPLSLELVD